MKTRSNLAFSDPENPKLERETAQVLQIGMGWKNKIGSHLMEQEHTAGRDELKKYQIGAPSMEQ